MYTPTLTDETNVAAHKVFFGGISVYLEQHSGLFRNTPWLLDRLWDSEWALKLAARGSIPVNPRLLGEMTVSMLRGEDGLQRKEIHKLAAHKVFFGGISVYLEQHSGLFEIHAD